jgi:hypothetical protein
MVLYAIVLAVVTFRAAYETNDRLCGLVVRVPGYRRKGPGFGFRCYHFFRSSGFVTGSTQPREDK